MIPRTIHQIWLGSNPLPEGTEKWRKSYDRLMPDWDHRLWTDQDLDNLADQLLCPEIVMNKKLNMGLRCDTLRYEILRLHGGLYMDHDMEIFRPVDEIMMEDCLHFALTYNELSAVSNAMIASPTGHSFWTGFLMGIKAAVTPEKNTVNDVFQITGYRALAPALHAWLGKVDTCSELLADNEWVAGWLYEHGDLVVWSREAAHPYHFSEMHHENYREADFPKAYAAHHWQGEWVK